MEKKDIKIKTSYPEKMISLEIPQPDHQIGDLVDLKGKVINRVWDDSSKHWIHYIKLILDYGGDGPKYSY